jgi:endonuclease/exonuclease/phosphatase family metal-dependent hydrolase
MNIFSKLRSIRRLGTWLIWMLVAAGLVFRFTVRDSFRLWCLIYYVTPIPALPIWFAIAGLVGSPGLRWLRNDKPEATKSLLSPTRLNSLLGVVCLVWAVCSECGFRTGSAAPEGLRVVFWNTARVWSSVPRLAAKIKSCDASIVALVEADKNYREAPAEWRSELPDYSVVTTHDGGLVAVKGTVISNQYHQLSASSWCEQFELRVNSVEFTLLLVDVTSDLRRSRRKPLAALAHLANQLDDRPIVIVGDFNTPDDSVWFDPLREHHREAFREQGTGYAATWPVPLPVLKLDQVWVNKHVGVSQCRQGWSVLSDHRPVITDLAIPVR